MKYKGIYTLIFSGLIALSISSCKKTSLDSNNNSILLKNESTIPLKIVAHRGLSFIAPENTLASANLAWEQNADAVECDVWLSKDKKVIVSHDETTQRTTNGDYSIPKTNSAILRTLDAGSWKASQWAGEKLPFLEELIATVPKDKRLFIELKSGDDMDAKELVPYVKDIINNSGKKSQMTIISFELDALREVKSQMPDIPAILVTYNYFLNMPYLLHVVEKYKLDGLDTYYLSTTRWFIQECKKRNIPLYVWTLDDAAKAKKLMDYGLTGVTTNRAGYMRDELSN